MHVHMVNAGQTPQDLIRPKRDTQQRMARYGAKAIAVSVQRQPGCAPERLHGGKSAPVQADHDAAPALALAQLGTTQHGGGFIGTIECTHHMLACTLLLPQYPPHNPSP